MTTKKSTGKLPVLNEAFLGAQDGKHSCAEAAAKSRHPLSLQNISKFAIDQWFLENAAREVDYGAATEGKRVVTTLCLLQLLVLHIPSRIPED